MYKHSFGHFSTNIDAIRYKKELEEKYPNKELHVILEKRRSHNTWKKYCVCEFLESKKGENEEEKEKVNKKSQIHKKKKK